MSPCRSCTARCVRHLDGDLAMLLIRARETLTAAEIVPPNLRTVGNEMVCEEAVWAVRQDERACRLWWNLASQKIV